MKKILIVSATDFEIEGLKKHQVEMEFKNLNIDFLVTNPGLVPTAFALTQKLNKNQFDLVLNVGIAGSFNPEFKIGESVLIESETFGDFGADDNGKFLDIFQLGLMQPNNFPFINGSLIPSNFNLGFTCQLFKKSKGLTVNKASGNIAQINELIKLYKPDIENMEGAAVFYVCLQLRQKVLQLRTISNMVENRDKSKWNIPLALDNSNKAILELLKYLDEKL